MRLVGFLGAFAASWSIQAPIAHAVDYCSRDARIAAVDLSAPVDQSFLDEMHASGINTIIRYYDHENETLPGKTLRKAERDLILANGFHVAVVFQHNNNQFPSFTWLRGRQDAERSLLLAEENSQHKGSAIYFGVDGPWGTGYELANIAAYFREVRAKLAAAAYRVGVYGSGLVCEALLTNGLADLCWLGAPKTWPSYHIYYQTKKWSLAQLPTTRCGGRSVDFDQVSGVGADFGQFGY
jgi:Rv2525c-like, glycoside hydrolase-like domain